MSATFDHFRGSRDGGHERWVVRQLIIHLLILLDGKNLVTLGKFSRIGLWMLMVISFLHTNDHEGAKVKPLYVQL